jgi:hypothetical protein
VPRIEQDLADAPTRLIFGDVPVPDLAEKIKLK